MASNSFSISAKSCRNFCRFGAGACRHRPSVSRRSQHPHHRQQSKHSAWHQGHNGPTCQPGGMLIPDLNIRRGVGSGDRQCRGKFTERDDYSCSSLVNEYKQVLPLVLLKFTYFTLLPRTLGIRTRSAVTFQNGTGASRTRRHDAGGCCLPADLTAHHESVALKRPPGTKRAFYILLAPSRLQEACARRSMPARRH